MNEIIYLEPDDDIASVIGRIKEIDADGVSLMVPRGGTIAQSIVNLKLLKREIEKQNKIISLITGDKISRNLASQVGITIYSSVNEARAAKPEKPVPVTSEESDSDEGVIEAASSEEAAAGFVVNRYDKGSDEQEEQKNLEDSLGEEKTAAKADPAKATEPKPEGLEREKKDTEPIKPDKNEEIKKSSETIITSNSMRRRPEISHGETPISKPKKIGSRKKPLLIISGAFLILAIVLSYVFLPYANIDIKLASTDFAKDFTFSVDKAITDVNSADSLIPGTMQDTQGDLSKDFNTTGTKDAGTKSSGDIVFYNAYSSTDTQAIADGSVVSSQGLQFVTNGAVTIPAATSALVNGKVVVTPGQVKGHVTARESGDKYNLTPSKFTIESFSGDKRMNIYGQTTAALSGGTTKTIKIVSAGDIKNATDSLTKDLLAQLSDQISTEIAKDNANFLSTTASGEQVALEASAKEGDEAESFNMKLTLKVSGISFSETALKSMLSDKVVNEIGSDQMIINDQNTKIDFSAGSYDKDKGVVGMSAKYSTKIGKKINSGDIKNNIKNKKYGTARSYILGISGVNDVDLKVWPSFLARIPFISSRIKVTFGYQE
ncbi:MAG: hypothetical protein WC080_01940 [Patescibacteria group bacterium]